jgi:membrane protease YdiL (CAAX protease family)
VGLFVVMPLWLLYEVLRFSYVPGQMNLAEHWMIQVLEELPDVLLDLVRLAILVAVVLAARSIQNRHIPWLRVGLVILLEGVVYGLMLGPVGEQMTQHFLLSGSPRSEHLAANLIGSLGAGIYEELLFRLVLLSMIGWLFFRVTDTFSMPKWTGAAGAVLASSLLFSLFHYNLPNAFEPRVFVFRTMAGILLGLLFLLRGIGVCVYTHAMYDVFLYLDNP